MLVKLTGDPAIVDDPRFAGFAAQAVSYVQSFSYRDRLFGRPVHDEQGTYDRPHNLTVAFVPDKIDAVVRALGRAPWLAPRPRVVVFLGVENFKATFMLTRDGTVDRSADMRSVFAAAAERVGLSVAFPAQAELERAASPPRPCPTRRSRSSRRSPAPATWRCAAASCSATQRSAGSRPGAWSRPASAIDGACAASISTPPSATRFLARRRFCRATGSRSSRRAAIEPEVELVLPAEVEARA